MDLQRREEIGWFLNSVERPGLDQRPGRSFQPPALPTIRLFLLCNTLHIYPRNLVLRKTTIFAVFLQTKILGIYLFRKTISTSTKYTFLIDVRDNAQRR